VVGTLLHHVFDVRDIAGCGRFVRCCHLHIRSSLLANPEIGKSRQDRLATRVPSPMAWHTCELSRGYEIAPGCRFANTNRRYRGFDVRNVTDQMFDGDAAMPQLWLRSAKQGAPGERQTAPGNIR
jgi:hypothetical protein